MLNSSNYRKELKRMPWLLLALAIALLLLVGVVFASAQQVNVYDQYGHLKGTSRTHGDSTTFTDEYGHLKGTSTTHGDSTMFYDQYGHYEGSARRQGTPSNPLTGGRR